MPFCYLCPDMYPSRRAGRLRTEHEGYILLIVKYFVK